MTEEKQEEKVEQPELIEVRVVTSRGKSAVVEWVDEGRAFRKVVPVNKIKDGAIPEDVLEKAPLYGVPWAKEIKVKATAEDIENALHNAGIWTAEDALKNGNAIIGAINAAHKTSLATILRVAKKYIKKE